VGYNTELGTREGRKYEIRTREFVYACDLQKFRKADLALAGEASFRTDFANAEVFELSTSHFIQNRPNSAMYTSCPKPTNAIPESYIGMGTTAHAMSPL
jgi:hypothetical protein